MRLMLRFLHSTQFFIPVIQKVEIFIKFLRINAVFLLISNSNLLNQSISNKMKPQLFSISKKTSFLLILFFVVNVLTLSAQDEKRVDDEFPTPIAFPYDFLGNYSGNLNISDHTGSIANVPTEFSISKSNDEDVFIYQFSFIQGKEKIVNKYLLHIIDEDKGYYAITDDKGMEFMATLIKDVLYSTYDTKDTIMFTTLQFTNDMKLRFNVVISKKVKNKGKGGTNLSNVVQIQKALLSKV